jgi:hypothetical protein
LILCQINKKALVKTRAFLFVCDMSLSHLSFKKRIIFYKSCIQIEMQVIQSVLAADSVDLKNLK